MNSDSELHEWMKQLVQNGDDVLEDPSMQEIYERRRLGREQLIAQERALDLQRKLCEEIAAKRASVVGLEDRIKQLEDSDPELYRYIRILERINTSIWCPKCKIIKNIGVVPPGDAAADGKSSGGETQAAGAAAAAAPDVPAAQTAPANNAARQSLLSTKLISADEILDIEGGGVDENWVDGHWPEDSMGDMKQYLTQELHKEMEECRIAK